MAAFRFIGDPQREGEGPRVLNYMGLSFELGGDAVEVEDEAVAEKLRRNNHFAEGEAPKRRGRPPKAAEGEGE